MAASLLRSGRLASLKCLQVDGWGALRNGPAVWFCSQAKDPTKPVKKAKAAAKIAAAPDDRSALLAYKTAVLFPARLSEPGALSVQTPGEPGPPVSSSAISEPPEAAPPDLTGFQHATQVVANTTPPESPSAGGVQVNILAIPAATTPQEPAAADESSSSSSSDSDSDSDSEDEKLEEQTETRTSSSDCIEAAPLGKTQVQEFKGTEGWADAEAKHEAAEAAQPMVNPARVAPEESGESSPETSASTRGAAEASRSEVHAGAAESSSVITDAKKKTPASDVTQAGTLGKTQTDVPVEVMNNFIKAPAEPAMSSTGESQDEAAVSAVASESAPAETPAAAAAETPAEAAAETPAAAAAETPAEAAAETPAAAPAEAAAETPAEAAAETPAEAAAETPAEAAAETPAAAPAADVSIPTDSTEELVDPAPVSAEAAGEELQAETPAEQPTEAAAPAPEEPFDNSTYKNYQHHGYNTYTFVDLDVEMAQYRLPQPSSGRPSPRH